jgi:predicted 2-oxoglutarate/Fe(II)-dependent dioxygenase YbiX
MSVTEMAGIADNKLMQNIHNQFNMLLLASTIPYANRYGIRETLWHEPYQLLKYSSGQEYKKHYDGQGATVNRIISAVCYLNDDYEGGEWAFFNREKVIKVPKGAAVLFPSNFMYPHEIMPVIKGTRYSVITWFI